MNMGSVRFAHGFSMDSPMDSLWILYGFDHGFSMGSMDSLWVPWILYGPSMDSLWAMDSL
jgi:hypothetical protein